jgi:UDP-glucose 4-epimerase
MTLSGPPQGIGASNRIERRTPVMSLSRSSYLVLGATGFLGRALVDRLRLIPESVVCPLGSREIDLSTANADELLARHLSPETTLIVSTRVRPDPDPINAFQREIKLTLSIARALIIAPVRHCVYFSSSAIYGDRVTNSAITEATLAAPTNWYGIAKLTAENILAQVCDRSRLPLLLLRPCMVYGPGDRSLAYGPLRFLHSLLQEKRVGIYGDGSDRRDYLLVDDLAEIAGRLIARECTGIYNLASGLSPSITELVDLLRGIVAVPFEVVSLPRERASAEQRFDIQKLIAQIGPYEFVPLQTGLAKTWNCWYPQGSLCTGHSPPKLTATAA